MSQYAGLYSTLQNKKIIRIFFIWCDVIGLFEHVIDFSLNQPILPSSYLRKLVGSGQAVAIRSGDKGLCMFLI